MRLYERHLALSSTSFQRRLESILILLCLATTPRYWIKINMDSSLRRNDGQFLFPRKLQFAPAHRTIA